MTKGDFIEDWSSCVKCGRNKGIYGSNYILIHQGCEQCRQTSYTLGNPCVLSTKNFKCRPWRRKSLSESVSKGPCPDSLLSTTFLLLFVCTNIVQGVSYFLQKASSFKRDTNILWQFLLVGLLGGFMFPLVSCQEGLPNAVVYTGSVFTYNIPEDVFGCEVDSIVVSESVDRYLSHWLAYNSDKKQLYGVPSEKEKGTYNLLVVALTKDGKVGSHVCGSRSFSVKVLPANDELPASIHFGLGTSNKDDSNALRSPCNPGMQVVQGTAILNANMESLNGHERMTLILKMSDHLGVSLSRVSFFAGHASHPIIDKLDSPAVMAAGAGDGRFAKGSKSLLTWHIGCGAIKLDDLALSKLEADAQDGTISSLLGFPVFGWHVMSGTQRNQARHRVRRQAIRVPVTETPTSYTAPPSRLSNVSTSVIVSPTVKITSVFRGNSTIQLSAPGASSLVQNRTVIATSSAVNISRTMSLGMQSSGQILSSSAVSMSRSSSSAVSMSRSSESLQLQPSGNSTLHLASSSFLHSSLNSSFMTRTATVNVSSSAISSLLLPTTDMTNISSSIVVTPNHTMASVSQAAPISSVDRTFITLFISPTSYSSWISSRSTAQVNNSVFPRMSSFAVSLVSPSSVLSSAFRNLTTLFASSEIKLSTMQLNVSKAMLPTLSALPTSSPAPGLSSSFTSHNISSALTTALLYQTSSINIVSSLASLSPISSSLFESTVVKNLSSGIEAMNRTSILDKTATTLMQPTTNIVPIVTSIIVPTMPTLVTKTSYFATWPFKSSTVILSIPLFHSSSPALLWSSSVITSMSTVSKNFTSTAPLQPNVPSTEVLRSSLTASPVVTSLKLTSMVTSKSASGVLGNSTLKIIRSSPTLKTTSALSPMRTTAGETFLVTSASSRTPITSLTLEVDKSTTFTLPLASVSPVLRSSLADVSSTVSSRTWGSLSIAVMQSANESIESIATRKRLTTFSTQIGKSAASLPSSNTLFPGSSTSTSAFPSSKAFFVSSTILLQNSSTAVTLVKSTLSPGSLVVLSSTVVPSFTTSSLAQQSQNATAKSRTVFSITSFKITTTNLQTRRTVSSRSSLSRSSSLGINASASVTPASRTGTPTTETVTPSSLHTQFESIFSSFTGLATSVVVSTSVFSRSTASPVNSGSNYVSSRVPSSAQSSATFPPVNRTSRSIRKTIDTPRDSSTVVRLSNSTQIIMPTGSAMTQSVTSSSSIVRPTTERPNSPPKVYNEMGRVSAPAGKALYLRIPDDTFYDSEDRATTRNLSLSVGFASGDSIPSDFWLQFDNKTQTIYGLPLDAHVRSGVSGESLVLRARDSQGDEALDAFEVLVVPSEKPVVQELTLRISNNFRIFISNVSQRLLLLEKIAAFYGDSDSSQIRVLSFTAGSVIMEWTNDSLPTDTCDEEKIQFVENRILEDGEVREEFKEALRDFLVENATQIRMGVCKGTRPGDETTIAPAQQSRIEESNLWYKHVLIGLLFVLIILVLVSILVWYRRRRRSKPYNEKRTFKKRKPIILGQEIELEPIAGKALVLPDDDPSQPPSYLSETSLAKPVSSDDDDEEDYGKSPSIRYQPPPPFHAALTEDPRSSPPPAYMMPPMY
ncbi:uncharacterized protein LOC141879422 isoform X2 [Acropora palmata]|uniref:uncharacterized protein LOC141879422 isoform X2 n=1 Tax=Acropora palmata TaxID=6131 RepID=UPI003DA1BC98